MHMLVHPCPVQRHRCVHISQPMNKANHRCAFHSRRAGHDRLKPVRGSREHTGTLNAPPASGAQGTLNAPPASGAQGTLNAPPASGAQGTLNAPPASGAQGTLNAPPASGAQGTLNAPPASGAQGAATAWGTAGARHDRCTKHSQCTPLERFLCTACAPPMVGAPKAMGALSTANVQAEAPQIPPHAHEAPSAHLRRTTHDQRTFHYWRTRHHHRPRG
ncbi:hypothetical protein CYMTET_19067 [Cymbomonas tetramitiformis]|uniref:Uncharacterized protein n=1 Tax=Cymbomonas tetramitiformis TaxID=36881 RepID=A0AAE0G824_9CHLO|nr:hypothetical protein CYMTET_19067 [Cymbomonas tetramitiformis]